MRKLTLVAFISHVKDLHIVLYNAAKTFLASSATAAVCLARQSRAYLSRLSRSGGRAFPSTFRYRPVARSRQIS